MRAIEAYSELGDYGAINFENAWGGQSVAKYLQLHPDGEVAVETDEGDYTTRVHEVGEVSPEFVAFIRSNIQDYDDSKHHNFWLEGETI